MKDDQINKYPCKCVNTAICFWHWVYGIIWSLLEGEGEVFYLSHLFIRSEDTTSIGEKGSIRIKQKTKKNEPKVHKLQRLSKLKKGNSISVCYSYDNDNSSQE